ncbi:MutS-related protein [Acetivibrio cellulolyticus]|uniref:MutS-related protein n=1 Tax=Acetivibrio cellulolyticus TaxID=35830 RepID=UPI0001E2FB5A|nr:DNA mismatch repair protein MutS [Acetivibrio cellulolyticus]
MVKKVSLLYKDANRKLQLVEEKPEFIKDLQFDEILQIMTSGSNNTNSERVIVSVFAELCKDINDIAYRYDILQDFIKQPQMFSDIKSAFATMIPIERERQLSNRKRAEVSAEYKLSNGINMLLGYCKVCKKVGEVLKVSENSYLSDGLNNLSEAILGYVGNDKFNKLEKILMSLKKCVKGYIRLKLDASLTTSFKLKEAIVLDIDNNGFEKSEYITAHPSIGIKKLMGLGRKREYNYVVKEIDYILEENVDEIKNKILTNIACILEAMTVNVSSFLRNLSEEILFYEGAVKLVQTMKSLGMITTRAEMAPAEERTLTAEGMYDLSFALYLSGKGCLNPLGNIVTNDVCIKGEERIQIITGPNQGGKTTYIRAMGILQVLAQAGIPIPAVNAVVSPVDQLFTHFPVDEKPESNEGRLGEELSRILIILENATKHSLVLVNEAFASTNSKEGSIIAQDILMALAVIGARCSFVTHLYELALRVDNMNNGLLRFGRKYRPFISMAAQYEEICSNLDEDADGEIRKRTYRIIPGAPSKSSFAADIAAQFNIRYMDFVQKLI